MADKWQPARRLEIAYEREIRAIVERVMGKAASNAESPFDFAQLLEEFTRGEWLQEQAMQAASRMITGLAVSHARTWREAARLSMRGAEIYRALQNEMNGPVGRRIRDLVQRNAELIKSVPSDIAEQATSFVLRQQQRGLRASEIAKELHEQLPNVTAARIRLISRTEVSKASTALVQARSEDLGLRHYVWRTSKDSRVRPSHRKMDGVIIPWNDPPSPEALAGIESKLGHYHSGDAPNDRCYPEPLLRTSQVDWPAKVYQSGRIVRMTRAQFLQIEGAEIRA